MFYGVHRVFCLDGCGAVRKTRLVLFSWVCSDLETHEAHSCGILVRAERVWFKGGSVGARKQEVYLDEDVQAKPDKKKKKKLSHCSHINHSSSLFLRKAPHNLNGLMSLFVRSFCC